MLVSLSVDLEGEVMAVSDSGNKSVESPARSKDADASEPEGDGDHSGDQHAL